MTEVEAKEILEKLFSDSTNEVYPFTEEFTEALHMSIEALERQSADGCVSCAYEAVEACEVPCKNCKNAYENCWKAKR